MASAEKYAKIWLNSAGKKLSCRRNLSGKMPYEILAQKYRPKTFEEIIGQKAVVQTLQNAVRYNRLAQAYIFSGMRGTGKTTAARILAKALNCQHGPTPNPCNKCEHCEAIRNDRSVDVLEIDGASTRKVEEISPIRDLAKYKPIHSRYKVIYIDEVHMLSAAAFNSLLKTLEEPPPNIVFIFATTEFHKVPATIVSRCQHFEFKKISHKDIIDHLKDIAVKEKIEVSITGLNLIAVAAEGSLRDAQSLLDQAAAFCGTDIKDECLKEILGTINEDIFFACSDIIMEQKPEGVFALVEEIIQKGCDLRFFYKELIRHFRNLLLVKSVENPQDLIPLNHEEMNRLIKAAAKTGAEDILRYILALQQAEGGLRYSSHPQIFLEAVLIKLCHFKNLISLKQILKEIQAAGVEPGSPARAAANSGLKQAEDRRDPRNEVLKSPVVSGGGEMETALKDPLVKSFIETFKAHILAVTPLKRTDGEEGMNHGDGGAK